MKNKPKVPVRHPLSWIPVRRGTIYCAPACGGDCTYAEFLTATKKANALCTLLSRQTGHPWEPCVWENLGWHYKAVFTRGPLSVYGDIDTGYTANLDGRWAQSKKTPLAAVKAVVTDAKRALMEVNHLLKHLDGLKL